MTYSVPSEFTPFVESVVAAGEYESPEAVIAAGLRLLQQRELRREELRRELQKGIDSLDRGDFITLESHEQIEAYFADKIRDCLERADAKRTLA